MHIRKIAVLGSFAAGAALALAPLASADPAAVDPTLVSSTLDSEIASLNSIFATEAALAGDTVTTHGANTFDTVPLADAPQSAPFTTLDYELYGVNPAEAGPASDPGSYEVFNGALTEFDNAYNVELYSLFNGGALDTNVADYIQNGALDHALGLASTTDAAEYLFNFGLGDLEGFLGIFPSM